MDAYGVARLIEDIASTSSRTEKERLTKTLAESDIGKFILTWAYNPFITFGITPAISDNAGKLAFEFKPSLVEPLLQQLSSRELTGMAAEREIGEVMAALNEDGQRLLFLILSKDLKCGIAANTINQAMPGLIPVFSVQRAVAYEAKRMTKVMKAEFKLDGNRNTFLSKDGNGGFFSRTGNRVVPLDFLVPHVMKAAAYAAQKGSDALKKVLIGDRVGSMTSLNFMLDGEAMMTLFEETGAFRRKDEDALGAELHLYDMMTYEDFDAPGAVGEPLKVRRQWVAEFAKLAKEALAGTVGAEAVQLVPQFFVNNDAEVQALFERARSMTLAKYLARGNAEREKELLAKTIDKATGQPKVLEGIVVKDDDALYEKKKSAAWQKLKAEETLDLPIVGVYNGQEHSKYENILGGVIVDHKGVEVRVGGGISDEDRAYLWTLWEKDAAIIGVAPKVGFKGATFVYAALKQLGATNLLTRLLETEFMEVTPDGSLRHPRAIRFRDDKDGEVESREAA
ncbi:putative DNA ligase [Rhizobium phage V1VFA-S]|nr:putative DNA ligase [Rhizobium phage V1VFA-S]